MLKWPLRAGKVQMEAITVAKKTQKAGGASGVYRTWKVGEQVTGKGGWKKVGPYDERRVEKGRKHF